MVQGQLCGEHGPAVFKRTQLYLAQHPKCRVKIKKIIKRADIFSPTRFSTRTGPAAWIFAVVRSEVGRRLRVSPTLLCREGLSAMPGTTTHSSPMQTLEGANGSRY